MLKLISKTLHRFTIPVMLFSVTALFYFGCKKFDFSPNKPEKTNEAITAEFFTLPPNTNPAVQKVAAALKSINDKTPFIPDIAKVYGNIVWDKCLLFTDAGQQTDANQFTNAPIQIGTSAGATVVILPMVMPNGKYVDAFFKAVVGETTVLTEFYRNSDYLALPKQNTQYANEHPNITTAENFAIMLMRLDKEVFGYKQFSVKDKSLFANGIVAEGAANIEKQISFNDTNNISTAAQLSCTTYTETTITSYIDCPWLKDNQNCPTAAPGQCDGCLQYCTKTVSTSTSHTECHWVSGGGSGTGGWPSFPPVGGGGTGGGNPPPCPVVGPITTNNAILPCPPIPNPWPAIPPMVTFLQGTLNLNTAQTTWLIANPSSATQLFNYLELNTNATRIDVAKEHLNLSISNAAYFTFALSYTNTNGIMWWENEVWMKLSNYQMPEVAFNFYMDVTKPKPKKPQEFAAKCDGIEFISQASKTDGKERAGYITLDGKFIFAATGNTCEIAGDLSIKIKNGQAYYCYKKNLGAPTLTYFGIIDDNVKNEYCIPIRTSVHTHIPSACFGAVSIENDQGVSVEDKDIAVKIQGKVSNNVNFYVIESKVSGDFLVAAYDKTGTNYDIMANGLLANNICTYIF